MADADKDEKPDPEVHRLRVRLIAHVDEYLTSVPVKERTASGLEACVRILKELGETVETRAFRDKVTGLHNGPLPFPTDTPRETPAKSKGGPSIPGLDLDHTSL